MRNAMALMALLVAAGCAATTETHPIEQFAVVHAATDAGADKGELCFLTVHYYAHRTDQPPAGGPPLERMSGVQSLSPVSWVAPTFEADEAFRRAGYFRVAAPTFVTRMGDEASMFVGDEIRTPLEGGSEPRVERVGLETTARAQARDGGVLHLAIASTRLTRTGSGPEPNAARVATSLDLPPGYSAILRIVPGPFERSTTR